MKLNELKGALDAIHTRTEKAFGEVRGKLDELSAKIGQLEDQLQSANIPDDAVTALEDLKVLAGQLDDLVPDAPAEEPPVTEPQAGEVSTQ